MDWIKKRREENRQKDTNFEGKTDLGQSGIEDSRNMVKNSGRQIRMTAQESNAKGYFFRINGQNCRIMSYRGKEVYPIVPAYINGKPVRAIGKRVFAGSDIKGVVLPDTIRLIQECIVLNEDGTYQSKALAFLKQHINKATALAVQNNNI